MSEKPSTVPAHPSASAMLFRDGAGGRLEVLLMERSKKLSFAGGALVFPGGRLDAVDGSPARGDRAFRRAAIRETFEESGLLLAADGQGRPVAPDRAHALADAWREKVLADGGAFYTMLEETGLQAQTDVLEPAGHWVTPLPLPKRFDTLFYAARAPEGQTPETEAGEGVHVAFHDVKALLEAPDVNKRLMLPTRLMLAQAMAAGGTEGVLAAAAARDLVTVCPEVRVDGGRVFLQIPAEAGYVETLIPRDDIAEFVDIDGPDEG